MDLNVNENDCQSNLGLDWTLDLAWLTNGAAMICTCHEKGVRPVPTSGV